MDSNDGAYEASYDIGVLSTNTVKTHEILADAMFHTRRPDVIRGKVNTGAMATCMPFSMLCNIGLDEKDLAPNSSRLRIVTKTDLKTCGKLTVRVSCDSLHKQLKILITKLGTELILLFNFCKLFNLIAIADACTQRNSTLSEQVGTVHITDESEVDCTTLKQQ